MTGPRQPQDVSTAGARDRERQASRRKRNKIIAYVVGGALVVGGLGYLANRTFFRGEDQRTSGYQTAAESTYAAQSPLDSLLRADSGVSDTTAVGLPSATDSARTSVPDSAAATAAPQGQSAPQYTAYVVKRGDRLEVIVRRAYGVDNDKVARDSTNSVARQNAAIGNRSHFLTDNRAFVRDASGRYVLRHQADGELGDLIFPGDTVYLSGNVIDSALTTTAAVNPASVRGGTTTAPSSTPVYISTSFTLPAGGNFLGWVRDHFYTTRPDSVARVLTRDNPDLLTDDEIGVVTRNGGIRIIPVDGIGGDDLLAGREYTIRVRTSLLSQTPSATPASPATASTDSSRVLAERPRTETSEQVRTLLSYPVSADSAAFMVTYPTIIQEAPAAQASSIEPPSAEKQHIKPVFKERDLEKDYETAYGKSYTDVINAYNTHIAHGIGVEEASRLSLEKSIAEWNIASGVKA